MGRVETRLYKQRKKRANRLRWIAALIVVGVAIVLLQGEKASFLMEQIGVASTLPRTDGFDKTEAFPIDVWIKRVLAKYYPDGLDIAALGKYAGIAQQYLFYYERYNA